MSSSTVISPPVLVRVAADTDTGLRREHNEDTYLIDKELGLFAVADGVGGHVGGVEASGLVASQLPHYFKTAILNNPDKALESGANELQSGAQAQAQSNTNGHTSTILNETLIDTDFQRRLYRAIVQVNTHIYDAGADKADDGRMGATLTGALFLSSGTALIFNVGDSRTYCYRDDKLACVTKDQSWYQTWLDNGSVGSPPPKSVILQGVGLEESVVPDWGMKQWQANDLWLMCSDGLTDRVSDDAIAGMIKTHLETNSTLVALCGDLVAAANAAGGEDNITVLALRPTLTTS